jgi:heptosyltransferase-2
VDQVLIYDDRGRHGGVAGTIRLAKELRAYHFDAAILLQNAFEAALITFMAGIPVRIGYNRDGRGFLLTHGVRCTRAIKKLHQTGYYPHILQGAGLKTDGQALELFVGTEDAGHAREILARGGISARDTVVGINPGAAFGPAKQWLPENYARLADRICDAYHARILIFGGPGDRDLGRAIANMMQHRPMDLSGRTTLGQAMALIANCDLFVTNDSGLMHVAAALDTPLIAIFGSTNHITTGPWSTSNRIVRSTINCSPCLKPQCPLGHLECMHSIHVNRVFNVAAEMM